MGRVCGIRRYGVRVILFQTGEKESPVLAVVEMWDHDGPSDRKAVIVTAGHRPEQMVVSTAGEGLPGIQVLVAEILKARAVQLVGTGFGREVVQPTAYLAVFGGEVAGLQRHLFERLHRRLAARRKALLLREGSVLTVDPRGERIVGQSIDADIGTGSVRSGHEGGERPGINQGRGAAGAGRGDQGELFKSLDGDIGALFCVFRFQQRCVGRDADGLGGRADLQVHVDARNLRHLNRDAFLDVRAESGGGDAQIVFPGGKLGYGVIARFPWWPSQISPECPYW